MTGTFRTDGAIICEAQVIGSYENLLQVNYSHPEYGAVYEAWVSKENFVEDKEV